MGENMSNHDTFQTFFLIEPAEENTPQGYSK